MLKYGVPPTPEETGPEGQEKHTLREEREGGGRKERHRSWRQKILISVRRDPAIEDMFAELATSWNDIHSRGQSHVQEWEEECLLPCVPPEEPELQELRAAHVSAPQGHEDLHCERSGWVDSV